MEVAIIIVNYNGKSLLDVILKSIKKSTFKNYEIIVVDNNSDDGSPEFVKKEHKNVKLVQNKKNLGYSGINSALKYCKGEYILFLNNDMEIDNKCISSLIKTLKSDKDCAMAAPKLVNYYDRNLKSGGTWVSRAFYNGHIRSEGNDIVKEIPYLGVGLIKKNFVDMYGYLFDPDYFIYAEDLDLGLRIRLNGKKVLFDPDASIYHMHAVTTQKIRKAYTTYLMERNLMTTHLKILSLKHVILCLPYVKFARLVAIIKDILTLKFGLAFARTKALFWVAFNINAIIKKRQQTQKFRKADDYYILKIFSEKYLLRKKFLA